MSCGAGPEGTAGSRSSGRALVIARLMHTAPGGRSFSLSCERSDEVVGAIRSFAAEQRLGRSLVTGAGALRDAVLVYFDWAAGEHRRARVDEEVRLLSLLGTVASADGEPRVDAKVVLAGRDGTTRSGRLLRALAGGRLELVVHEDPGGLPAGSLRV